MSTSRQKIHCSKIFYHEKWLSIQFHMKHLLCSIHKCWQSIILVDFLFTGSNTKHGTVINQMVGFVSLTQKSKNFNLKHFKNVFYYLLDCQACFNFSLDSLWAAPPFLLSVVLSVVMGPPLITPWTTGTSRAPSNTSGPYHLNLCEVSGMVWTILSNDKTWCRTTRATLRMP